MRFWILLLTLIVTVAAVFEGSDLMEGVTFNPLGHYIEPKIVSDLDSREREYIEVHNSNEPEWGKVNYGNLDTYSTTVTDINGVTGKAVGDAKAIMNMLDNSTVDSTVKPAPSGLTVNELPGVQADGKPLNSFAFTLSNGGALMSPRHYYLSEVPVSTLVTDKGVVTKSLNKLTTPTNLTNLTVMQVPYGEDFFITDTTGVTKEASQVGKANAEIKKSLNELSKLAEDRASREKLSAHLFNTDGMATSYQNINTMINSGAYKDSYQQGLGIALGTNAEGVRALPGVHIKTNGAKDTYAQFDQIYQSMISRGGSKSFSPALVDWAQKNATSIVQTLMINYMIQSQFQGKEGAYSTPISMNYWNAGNNDFNKKIKAVGRQSKEPFYLYSVIDPKAQKLSSGGLPVFKDNEVQPHLTYIFNLYTAIHSQVWVGMSGVNMTGSVSTSWSNATKAMASDIKSNKVKGDNLPYNANNTTFRWAEVEHNNLVGGLSTGKGKDPYPNDELIGALRLIMSSGEHTSSKEVKLYNGKVNITAIDKNKYSTKFGANKMYNAFATNSSDMFTRWEAFLKSGMNVPIHPVVFRSKWDKSDGQGAYIMMPVLLGGKEFPESLEIMLGKIATAKEDDGGKDYLNMSHANRYIMTFNVVHSKETKTANTTGVVRVDAGATIGKAKDNSKPIVITGYLGGEKFSIVDYFLTQDALLAGNAKPPVHANTVVGKKTQLDYFRIFEDFYTVRNVADLSDDLSSGVKFNTGFDKEKMISNYEAGKASAHIKRISPDYSKFFESKEKEEVKEGD